jgi:hypothetical protein
VGVVECVQAGLMVLPPLQIHSPSLDRLPRPLYQGNGELVSWISGMDHFWLSMEAACPH